MFKPYLRKSVVTANDLTGTALPTVTTTNSYAGGYLTLTEAITSGNAAGIAQTVTQRVAHEYWPDNVSGENWLLGLVKKTTTTRTVPNSLGAISASAGSAPKATATAGP